MSIFMFYIATVIVFLWLVKTDMCSSGEISISEMPLVRVVCIGALGFIPLLNLLGIAFLLLKMTIEGSGPKLGVIIEWVKSFFTKTKSKD